MSKTGVICSWIALAVVLSSPQLADAQVKKSLVIGVDALGFGEKGFSNTATPRMDSLIDGTWAAGYNGAYADNAFAGGVLGEASQQATVSGPGWTSMVTGVWANKHNVTDNSFSSPNVATYPAYFSTAKSADNSLVTATVLWWEIFDNTIMDPINSDGDPNNNLDYQFVSPADGPLTDDTVEILNMDGFNDVDADMTFVEFGDLDGAGHSCGGSSGQCYADEMQVSDMRIGLMLDALKSRPTFASEDWQIIITSDHGQTSSGGHGGQSEVERTIPFIVSSKSLSQGTLPAGVSQVDVAPTVLGHFGIPIPGNYDGISRATGAFIGNPDINGNGVVFGDGTGPFETDDVTAFVSLWQMPNTLQDPNPADLNGDGIANLADWAILNDENPSMGAAILRSLSGTEVPEPSTSVLGALALVGIAAYARRERRTLRPRRNCGLQMICA